MRNRPDSFATRAIHHGYDPMENEGALTPPLHLTSTFAFETAEAGGEMFAGERAGHIYSRISNPTCDLLEKRIAVLGVQRQDWRLRREWGRFRPRCGHFLRQGMKSFLIKLFMAARFLSCSMGWPSLV